MAENRTYNDSPTFIPARLESAVHSSIAGNEGKGPVADAKDIYDIEHQKWQGEINEEVEQQGEHLSQVDESLADKYNKSETYSKSEVDQKESALGQAITDGDSNLQGQINTVKGGSTKSIQTIDTEINGTGGIDSRLHRVEELGTISVGGGDIGIATEEDFGSDTPADLAKVPTVEAIQGGLGDGVYDISARNSGAVFASLEALLSDANLAILIPTYIRKGGMSIRFIQGTVQSNDNKYVQYMYLGTSIANADFVKVANWKKLFAGDIYVKDVNVIKELYFTDAASGIELCLENIKRNYNGTWKVQFCNNAGNAFTAETNNYTSEPLGILPILQKGTTTIIGYIILDWNNIYVGYTNYAVIAIGQNCYNIDYSPAIKNYITDSIIEGQGIRINTLDEQYQILKEEIYEKDTAPKDMSLITSATDTTDYIWVEYPQDLKIRKVNRVRFKAYQGSTNFYVVTINEDSATWELITSVINDVSEEQTIKVVDFDAITLNSNQFIGVNGSVFFSSSAQGFTASNIVVATGAVNNPVSMTFAYIVENTESIFGQFNEINEGTITTSVGHSVGKTINEYDTVITLASDGTGDNTTFHAAANAAMNAAYGGSKVLLLIKSGIYTINAEQKGGSGYPVLFDIKGIGNVQIECLYDGTDTALVESFAPLNLGYISKHSTVKIENITLVVDNVRYCVHDEMGSLNMESYTHIFKNCKFVHKTSPNSTWDTPRCIGGGLGNKGLIIIDNCEFDSVIDTSVDYHSGYEGGAESSKVIIENSLLANNTVSCSSVKAKTSEKSYMVVTDCILHDEPHYYNSSVGDIQLITRNNIII